MLTLTEKKELDVLPSLDYSIAPRFVRYVGEFTLTGLEREGEKTRKSGRSDLLKWTIFFFFFLLHCETVAC